MLFAQLCQALRVPLVYTLLITLLSICSTPSSMFDTHASGSPLVDRAKELLLFAWLLCLARRFCGTATLLLIAWCTFLPPFSAVCVSFGHLAVLWQHLRSKLPAGQQCGVVSLYCGLSLWITYLLAGLFSQTGDASTQYFDCIPDSVSTLQLQLVMMLVAALVLCVFAWRLLTGARSEHAPCRWFLAKKPHNNRELVTVPLVVAFVSIIWASPVPVLSRQYATLTLPASCLLLWITCDLYRVPGLLRLGFTALLHSLAVATSHCSSGALLWLMHLTLLAVALDAPVIPFRSNDSIEEATSAGHSDALDTVKECQRRQRRHSISVVKHIAVDQ
ncbi:MAG: hypothetical protein MHM6MM_003684 [Cercozoa sp. M6MM]